MTRENDRWEGLELLGDMTCPECGGVLTDDWFIAWIGPKYLPVEFHVAFCLACDWVTVLDWRKTDDDTEDDDANTV